MRDWHSQVYQPHASGLLALACHITKRMDLAEDAVHDAFLSLAGKDITTLDNPVAYAFTTVRHAALQQRKQHARQAERHPSLNHDPHAATENPLQILCTEESHQQLWQALDQLTFESREVVLLKTMADLSFQQIADILNEPLNTLSARYYRALKQLQHHLERTGAAPT